MKKKKTLNKISYGFTLSEILVAMVVLGIILVLTVGIMMADYNKEQVIVRLKKADSVLSNAFTMSSTKNGSPDDWELQSGTTERASYEFFHSYLKPDLVLARDCKSSSEGQCNYEFKELNGRARSLSPQWTRFFLNDGAFVALQTYANDKFKVVYFYVDTNGKKRLNVVGRDIFMFIYWIRNDDHPDWEKKLLPYGHEYLRSELLSASNPSNCNALGGSGDFCSALIIKDNWKIKNDYPWAQARYAVK